MGLRMKKFNIMGGSLKNSIFKGGGEFPEKPVYWGELPKNGGGGGWAVSKFKGGLAKKRGGGYF